MRDSQDSPWGKQGRLRQRKCRNKLFTPHSLLHLVTLNVATWILDYPGHCGHPSSLGSPKCAGAPRLRVSCHQPWHCLSQKHRLFIDAEARKQQRRGVEIMQWPNWHTPLQNQWERPEASATIVYPGPCAPWNPARTQNHRASKWPLAISLTDVAR